MDNKDLRKIDEFDPIEFAERNGLGMGTAFALHLMRGKTLREEAFRRGDTSFTMGIEEYRAVLEVNGFQKLLDIPFMNPHQFDEDGGMPHEEHFYVYWDPRRFLLLVWDTYRGQRNAGSVYFALKTKRFPRRASGSFSRKVENVFLGYLDCRMLLINNLEQMEEEGEFVEWPERPWLWLLHYGDTTEEGYDHDRITKERLALLPEEVQKAIGHGQ